MITQCVVMDQPGGKLGVGGSTSCINMENEQDVVVPLGSKDSPRLAANYHGSVTTPERYVAMRVVRCALCCISP